MSAQMTSPRLSAIQVTFSFALLENSPSNNVMQPLTCERYTSSIHSQALIYIVLMEHLTTAPTTTQIPRNIVRRSTQRLGLPCSLNDHLAHIHRLDRTLPDPTSQWSRLERWFSSTTHNVTVGFSEALGCCWRHFV
jgi:hypothetical protein